MWTKAFWKAQAERVISSIAEAAVAVLVVGNTGIFTIDFVDLASVSLLAGLISLLKGLVANAATGTGPSLVSSEVVIPAEVLASDVVR
jgi:hypothetical protein